MRVGFKAKRIIKMVALALAGVAAITAVAFGVKAIVDYTKNDLKTINPSFEVGSLGSDGKYVADEGSLYTKEAFGCYGLQVKPDFDSTVDYQVFYYDILDHYISSSEVLSEGYGDKAPLNGAYARIVIMPRDDEDGKIGFTEKIKYSNQLTVKVKKDQDLDNRFINFKGRLMQVVAEKDELVFKNNMRLSPTTVSWEESTNYNYICVTSCTVLKVEGGETFNFDFAKLGENFSSSSCRVFEFNDIPLEDNIVLTNNDYSVKSGFVLGRNTKYIIIQVESTQAQVSWSETDLLKLPSCFAIIKSK